jgi:hypothetical protein
MQPVRALGYPQALKSMGVDLAGRFVSARDDAGEKEKVGKMNLSR